MSLFLGIDIGTQGVRAILAGTGGEVIARAGKKFILQDTGLSQGWSEQEPELWWEKTKAVISDIRRITKRNNIDIKELKAIAVTSTSGTIIALDKENNVLHRAIMYNDTRATEEANQLNIKGGSLCNKMGYAFSPSFALSKILWIKKNKPDIFLRTRRFAHAADYIVGKITGNFSISDTSNALKTGFDLIDKKWPSFISGLGIDPGLFPEVKLPGEVIGEVRGEVEKETGIPKGVLVCAGATDGVASFFASGAALPGDWNSTLGTTLVVKGVSEEMLKDKLGRFYSHFHPQGYWLPGGASSCGGESLRIKFKGNLSKLDEAAGAKIPTGVVIYPLMRKGERCPFVNSDAQGFMIGKPKDKFELYAAYLEGVGLVEKWIYEVIEELGGKVKESIYVSGGASYSDIWLKIRAAILNKVIIRSQAPEAAYGGAIIAGSKTFFSDISQAVRTMVKKDIEVEPEKDLLKAYDAGYRKFRKACKAIGYG
jgi:xylulokinase